MDNRRFLDDEGSFEIRNAQKHTGLYFPIAGEYGMKSAVTPNLGGDAKLDQNHFLLAPVSIENLHNDRSARNFWCIVEGRGAWSAAGNSAKQHSAMFTDQEEEVTVRAGYMWHEVMRSSSEYGLSAKIASYVPIQKNMEVHIVEIQNISDSPVSFVPVAAIPVYGRSADNIRDHRHVTSLLHRIKVKQYGVQVFPTLSFDERGHQVNDTIYFVNGMSKEGKAPESFFPETSSFIGEGGSLENPKAVICNEQGEAPGVCINGQEALGGLRFAPETLKPGGAAAYVIFAGSCHKENEINKMLSDYSSVQDVKDDFERTKQYWKNKVNVSYETGDKEFNQFMNWVSFQPELRRLFGCSFLPHHDYGKGGRGWRDLWQDCLALLLMNPGGVRQMLLGNFAGVRMDGSNATIIGEHLGEFKADRNSITRVWMDHGVWPFMTTKLYIDQTGDADLLNQDVRYFKDRQIMRGTAVDDLWETKNTWQMDARGHEYKGTVLEHLLLQNLTAFWEVGEHNHIRLRDADWNDALDMAGKRGESVAFSNAYAKNLLDLADMIEQAMKKGKTEFELLGEIEILLKDDVHLYEDVVGKRKLLTEYMETCRHTVSGIRIPMDGEMIAKSLRSKGNWMMEHIRKTEWLSDSRGNGWFNGYYDNSGRPLEGEQDGKSRMMLTSQVFAIMAGTATDEQIEKITKSADAYLYDEACGGYRLNTDFGEVKTDMGRMFGFAYGEKENGAVFSHMAVMYANALYQRGFVKEGYRSLNSLYRQSMDFEKSHIYPGIPEYFGKDGRGLYHYLTGAASWYMLTVMNQMFGVRGESGDLVIEPKLLLEQFDEEGFSAIHLKFAGKNWKVEFENADHLEYGSYQIAEALLDGNTAFDILPGKAVLPLAAINRLDSRKAHKIHITLKQEGK